MKLDKAMLATRLVASSDETRNNLAGVYFDSTGATATNGHVLAKVAAEPDNSEADAIAAGLRAIVGAELEQIKPFMLSTADVAALDKAMPKAPRYGNADSYLPHVDVAGANANGHVPISIPAAAVELKPSKHEAKFPDVTQVYPKGERTYRVAFNADYLTTLAKIAKAAGADNPVLTLEFYEEKECAGAIRVTCSGAPRFRALLMPCKP